MQAPQDPRRQQQRIEHGFDCQGLWVEVEVEKELGLKSKRDIENLVPGDRFASIDKFVNLCKLAAKWAECVESMPGRIRKCALTG